MQMAFELKEPPRLPVSIFAGGVLDGPLGWKNLCRDQREPGNDR